jgi:hypothetical protein
VLAVLVGVVFKIALLFEGFVNKFSSVFEKIMKESMMEFIKNYTIQPLVHTSNTPTDSLDKTQIDTHVDDSASDIYESDFSHATDNNLTDNKLHRETDDEIVPDSDEESVDLDKLDL